MSKKPSLLVCQYSEREKNIQKKIYHNTNREKQAASHSKYLLIPRAEPPHNYQKELVFHSLKCGAVLDGLFYEVRVSLIVQNISQHLMKP